MNDFAPRNRKTRFDELPTFPIAPILEELGMDMVPTGFGWRRCRCPFHDDKTASAGVNHEVEGFRCLACGVSGDALKLLQDQLGLSFIEAFQMAKELTGVTERRSHSRRASDLLKGAL